MKATVTNTAGIMHLVMNASGRNRCVHEEKFVQAIDPSGIHFLSMQFPHNDVEMRTQWMCRMKDTKDPAVIWLDVDFDALSSVITELEMPATDPELDEFGKGLADI